MWRSPEAHICINNRRGTHDYDGGVTNGVAKLQEEAVECIEENLAKVHVIFQNDVERCLCIFIVSVENILLQVQQH
jgi:hypothetical protein